MYVNHVESRILPTQLLLVEIWMQTVPKSHVLTGACEDFKLLHSANYSRGHALMPRVYKEQMDNGTDRLTQ